MQEEQAAGIAAPQIGHSLRIFVLCVGEEVDERGRPNIIEPKVYINPKITQFYPEFCCMREGCVSVPGLALAIERPFAIDIEAQDIEGNIFKETLVGGWKSRCIQHELDHLNGILFFDKLSEENLSQIQEELLKIEQDCQYSI